MANITRLPQTPPEPEPEPTDDLLWAGGTFTVISSDGEVFNIKEHVLFWASPRFRDITSPVHLTERYEDAATVRLFLQLVSTLDATGPGLRNNNPAHIVAKTQLLLFLRAGGCNALYKLVEREQTPCYAYYPLHAFQMAALLDDELMVRQVLQLSALYYRSPAHDPWSIQLKTSKKDEFDFDPLFWTATFWAQQEIPPVYLQALTLAHAASRCGGSMASNFEEQFSKICPRRPSEKADRAVEAVRRKRRRVDPPRGADEKT